MQDEVREIDLELSNLENSNYSKNEARLKLGEEWMWDKVLGAARVATHLRSLGEKRNSGVRGNWRGNTEVHRSL